jgi:hypothetical protein
MINFVSSISSLVVTEPISLHQNQGNAVGRPDAVTESTLKLIDSSPSRHRAAAGCVVVTGAPW